VNRNRTALALVAVALAACQAAPPVTTPSSIPTSGASGAPSPAASPTADPLPASPAATMTPGPSVEGLEAPRMVRVATDNLRMRSEPGVQETSVRLTPLLDAGVVAFVLDGPVEASGFEWYRIHPLDDSGRLPEVGWIAAAGKDGEPWVETEPTRCAGPAIEQFGDLLEPAALACYGSVPQAFVAKLGDSETGACFELDPAWQVEPAWFDPCHRSLFLVDPATPLDDAAWGAPSYAPAFAPEVVLREPPSEFFLPVNWLRVSVTGRFDHPAARTCHTVANPGSAFPEPRPDPAVVVLRCRMAFVVTALDVLPR
jgi:hypothetical protein